jgi:hypothetical protein
MAKLAETCCKVHQATDDKKVVVTDRLRQCTSSIITMDVRVEQVLEFYILVFRVVEYGEWQHSG